MYYVAVDIGCIECGEPSSVLGIYTDKSEAEATLAQAEEKQKHAWTGQHYFELFEIETIHMK